jgi:hypothetical protein
MAQQGLEGWIRPSTEVGQSQKPPARVTERPMGGADSLLALSSARKLSARRDPLHSEAVVLVHVTQLSAVPKWGLASSVAQAVYVECQREASNLSSSRIASN